MTPVDVVGFLWENLGLLLALTGVFVTLIKKSYGYERDIRHIQRDIPQLSANMTGELRELERSLKEIESALDELKGDIGIIKAKSDWHTRLMEILERKILG